MARLAQTTSSDAITDLTIVGAGLSGLLTAWRCLDVNPGLTITIHERADRIAGDHTWSFNESDIPPGLLDWFSPFIRHRWPRYDVRFPDRVRTLDIPYATGDSQTLRTAVEPLIQSGRLTIVTGREAPASINGPWLDATGYATRDDEWPGWQKFVGHVIRTQTPHGIAHPVIMDATVSQIDGYRFVYLLPFSETDILVEDTYFSDLPSLSENEIAARIDDYIAQQGWSDHQVLRREKGILPMMMATDRQDESAKIGLGGGFSVAATGFTVPVAVELADHVAQSIRRQGAESAPAAVAEFRRMHLRRERYARLLNRMFFRAADPVKRFIVLQRFYGLGEGLIRRFYRNALTWRDKSRILIGKPPVPVDKAFANLSESAFIRRERDLASSQTPASSGSHGRIKEPDA